jgi:hypothetical protein
VNVAEATPAAVVVTVAIAVPDPVTMVEPLNVPLAPDAGAVNVTVAPLTGLP